MQEKLHVKHAKVSPETTSPAPSPPIEEGPRANDFIERQASFGTDERDAALDAARRARERAPRLPCVDAARRAERRGSGAYSLAAALRGVGQT